MEIIEILCGKAYESETEVKDSAEFQAQNKNCNEIYQEVSNMLNEEQMKKLLKLDSEYFKLSGIWHYDGFKEGFGKGFKLSARLFVDCLRD